MSNLITDEKKTIWRLDAYDCKEGCNCLKVRFSNKNTWACVRAEIFCDNSPIGLCVLVNSEKENTSYCETDRISGVHNIELRLSHPSDILEAELMDSDVYKDAGYVPTNEKDLCDTDSQSWEAVDMLGRKVASVEDVKGYRPEKKVGIFYWTWREGHSERRPVNVSKLLEKYPAAEYDMNHPAWGEEPLQCHWNEPFFGYYKNSDPYIIRKHAVMLANAGVDFLMFDCTNGNLTWRDAYEPLLKGLHEARQEGIKTPQVAFMLNFAPMQTSDDMLRVLYQDLYRPGRYSDLWFRIDGKPLIMAYPEALPEKGICETDTKILDEIRAFFAFRPGQPLYAGGPVRNDQWGWLEVYPQNKYCAREDGSCEMVTVGVGQNANKDRICTHFNDKDTFGRSYTFKHGFDLLDKESYKFGYNVQEQWDRAIDLDPDIVFITGWNEWQMGRYHEPWLSDPNSTQVAMVDQYDREHSRDIEPDIDGYLDTYYLQMIHNIRRFKGAPQRQKTSEAVTININGSLRQWKNVAPVYLNNKGSAINRDWDGYGDLHYVNNSARNNIVKAQVARDEDNIYFIAQTANRLTEPSEEGWMTLYIDVDRQKSSGWEGYDFVINRTLPRAGKASVEKYLPTAEKNSYSWQKIGSAKIKIKDDAVIIEIPRELLGVKDAKLDFEFKWSDNMQSHDVMDFYANGDCAPLGRFNYLYQEN